MGEKRSFKTVSHKKLLTINNNESVLFVKDEIFLGSLREIAAYI